MKPNRPAIAQDFAIMNAYTVIAVVYCATSGIIFYAAANNTFLSLVHFIALVIVTLNYLGLKKTNDFKTAKNIILVTGTFVVLSLFITGGWENTGYLWTFAYIPFAFFLSGRRDGLFWIYILLAVCLLAVALNMAGIIVMPYSFIALLNYFAVFAVVIVCINVFQKSSIRQYEGFLSHVPNLLATGVDPFFSIDADGYITDINHAAEKLTRLSPNDLIDANFAGLFTEPERALEMLEIVFTNGLVSNFSLVFNVNDGGDPVNVIFNATLYNDKRWEAKRVFAIARNIAEQKVA